MAMPIEILIADDHAVMRDGLRMILSAEDDIAVVGEAADGRAAVAAARRLRPDIAVMDIGMPGLNGIEATIQIKEYRPETEVIMLSMHATAEYIHRALSAGALGYLLKESAGREVIRAVRTVSLGRRYLSEKITDTILDGYIQRREEPPEDSPLERLSAREREVLQLVVEGKSSKEIARILHLSAKTVETYRSRLMQKLDVHNIPALVKFAIEHGVTTLE
jgi:DNA-binding NarL/FixJ family response regulator